MFDVQSRSSWPDHHDHTLPVLSHCFSVNCFDWSGKSAYAVTQKPASFRSRFSHKTPCFHGFHEAELQWFMEHLVMILLHIHHFFCDSNSKNHHKDHPIVIIHHSSSPLSQKMEQWDSPTHSSFIIIIIFRLSFIIHQLSSSLSYSFINYSSFIIIIIHHHSSFHPMDFLLLPSFLPPNFRRSGEPVTGGCWTGGDRCGCGLGLGKPWRQWDIHKYINI